MYSMAYSPPIRIEALGIQPRWYEMASGLFYIPSPMDVMMKSSPRVRRVRVVERPYDVLVTDSTPGKECISSASYGLGQIPDKGIQ